MAVKIMNGIFYILFLFFDIYYVFDKAPLSVQGAQEPHWGVSFKCPCEGAGDEE